MGMETLNKNRNNEFHGDYAGRDLVKNIYITLYEEQEREFIVTHNVNISPAFYFTGRDKELQELRQRVEEGRKSILISGMGGIGKTHICRKLFREYEDKYARKEAIFFSHIGYIEYENDINTSLLRCLKYKQQEKLENNLEAAWRELEFLASDGKLLLFIDNMNTPIGQDSDLNRLCSIPGAVVLSSRLTCFGNEFEPYHIGFLTTLQCKEVYEKIRFNNKGIAVKPEEIKDLKFIIEKLAARHTLTIELLARLAKVKCWSVGKLKKELEEKTFKLQFKENQEIINIQESFEVLYNLSELKKAEQNILETFSLFPYIPLSIEVCNEWLLEDAGASKEDDILNELYEKGWIQFVTEEESYVMHPVYAQFILERQKPKEEEHKSLVKACQYSIDSMEENPLECQKYIPFAEALIRGFKIFEPFSKAELMSSIAYSYYSLAEYEKAEPLYQKSLKIREEVLGESHPSTASSYNNLATLYESQGAYEEAEPLYQKSLKIREAVLGENHSSTASSYNNLAGLYKSQGAYEKAEPLYQKSLKICEEVLGENHSYTASSYNNLAVLYKSQGAYEKAEPLYQKSLKIWEEVLGENHPSTASSYNNLATLYESQGAYEKAEPLYQKSLKICEEVLGDSHPSTASSYNNLAGLYYSQGAYEKAEPLYQKSLKICEEVLGDSHPSTASSYNNLAGIYKSQGEYEKAEPLYQKSLKIYEEVLGDSHPSTAICYNNLAGLYYSQGAYEKAEPLYQKSLKIRQEVLGESHPSTACSYNNLGALYESKGAYEKAEPLYQKSFKICEEVLGENHPRTQLVIANLRQCAQAMYGNEFNIDKIQNALLKE